MTQPKLNVCKVNYTCEDQKASLKQHILNEWINKNHPEIVKKIDEYVETNYKPTKK